MIPVFSFIAWSGTGKTTYLEKLIAELKQRGLRVAVIKHDAHHLSFDREGKDSFRFAQAGADVVAVADPEKCAVMEYRPVSWTALLEKIRDVDLILAEGWHAEASRPVVLWRSDTGHPPKLDPSECIAAVSDVPMETSGTPLFPLDDPSPMADFLIAQLSANHSGK